MRDKIQMVYTMWSAARNHGSDVNQVLERERADGEGEDPEKYYIEVIMQEKIEL